MTLPAKIVPSALFRTQYSIPPQARESQPLKGEVAASQAWNREPIQLNRGGSSISKSTWENVLSSIFLYLGFLHFYLDIPKPTLASFVDPTGFAKFMAFQMAKGNSTNSLTNDQSLQEDACIFVKIYCGRHCASWDHCQVCFNDQVVGQTEAATCATHSRKET